MSARILIVDDNATNLKLASEVLEMSGYEIHRATDAEEALLMLETLRPDLILMDIAMPGMDGLALTRMLKQRSEMEGVPIVALSAFAMKGDRQKALDAGCEGYITKPINTRTLPVEVSTFLPGAERA